jgi:6-phosphofructokinase 1
MKTAAEHDFTVDRLGPATIPSPLKRSTILGDSLANYVRDDEYILYDIDVKKGETEKKFAKTELLEKAGPREKIYFHPGHTHAGIVTCGGLCPGLNDVIRAVVRGLWHLYGVTRITGIKNGYRGFLPEYNLPTVRLDPEIVDDIHYKGGTVLGSSRGGGKHTEIADAIERLNLNVLFTIGGDGTQRGALAIAEELEKRNSKVSVIGIPKTIDNDISFVQKSFGFETAVSIAVTAVSGAHVEARDAINGIGLVKVMGRESGYIAAYTALAQNDVNFVLIPEIPFDLEGELGLYNQLEQRLERRNHAVILVAEGAGQDLLEASSEKDASGNRKLQDIGHFLERRIPQYFKEKGIEASLKYIDPSYMIRSAPAEPNDSVYCARLGTHAVHAAMSGRTKMLISLVNNHFVHLPIEMAVSRRNYIDPEGPLWRDVLEVTGQPVVMKNT